MNCVEIENIVKSYQSSSLNAEEHQKILNGLNLHIKYGTIYALIGASGCGKTTLLTCLLGMQRCQSGEIKIFNRKVDFKRCSQFAQLIGYMPQTASIPSGLTVFETLQYFSNLHMMPKDVFVERFGRISEILCLPPRNTFIRQLSGGERRRMSLAVTIIHNPRLLILDEPTVGVDFLLCDKIWNFLHSQTVEERLTVLITTHYLSEAAKANRCGFMRNGRLIVENSPENILKALQVETLDEAFLELCTKSKKDEKLSSDEEEMYVNSEINNVCEEEERMKTFQPNRKIFRRQVLMGLVVKEWNRMKRQPGDFFVVFFICTLQLTLSYLVNGRIPKNIPIGVVDYSSPDGFCESLQFNQSTSTDFCPIESLSCEFLNHITDIQRISYKNYSHAVTDYEGSKIFGFITISPNFSGELLPCYLELNGRPFYL